MNLIEGFVRDEIFVDFGSEIMYGSYQQNVSYPSRFPTVEFQLIATFGLSQIADRIRKDAGFKPMHPMDEFTDDTCDNEGWYDFYVGINGFTHNHMDSCIEFYVVNADSLQSGGSHPQPGGCGMQRRRGRGEVLAADGGTHGALP